MTGIIAKAIRGASEAGVPMLQEQHRNNIAANREQAMQRIMNKYRQAELGEEREFRAEQSGLDRDLTVEQGRLDREQRASEAAAQQEDARAGRDLQGRGLDLEQERVGLQEQELGLRQEQFDLTAQKIAQELELGNFGLIEAERLDGIRGTLVNPEASQEEKNAAIEMIENLTAANPTRYTFLKAAGEFGEPDRVVRLNDRTGEAEIVNLDETPSGVTYKSPEEVRAAYKSGSLVKSDAEKLLQMFRD